MATPPPDSALAIECVALCTLHGVEENQELAVLSVQQPNRGEWRLGVSIAAYLLFFSIHTHESMPLSPMAPHSYFDATFLPSRSLTTRIVPSLISVWPLVRMDHLSAAGHLPCSLLPPHYIHRWRASVPPDPLPATSKP